MSKKYSKILIANRGDSAVRIIRACKELGIETVAIYSKADRGALHTKLADYAVCIGDARNKDSYMNSYSIMTVANKYKVDAIHPGTGYFAESSDFSELCNQCEIDFIGPNSLVMEQLGNKVHAKVVAKSCNIPVVGDNSYAVSNEEDCIKYAKLIGYPIILKAANGGGGKGIRIVQSEDELLHSLDICLKECKQIFGESSILIEKYIERVKHIEVQILADKHGNIIHLWDRECSVQRCNQKFIEETRCCTISEKTRIKMYQGAIDICKKINYEGLGTIEFIVDEKEDYYFIEMNTRLQVEHTITEMITGIDIVKEQIRIAQGEVLSYKQDDVKLEGYAIQCRILAESYVNVIIPSCGEIYRFDMPGGFGVRIDTGYTVGNIISPYYDSLLCKLCCFGKSKDEALEVMKRCIEEMQIEGVNTNIENLIGILRDTRFINGQYNTTTFFQQDTMNVNKVHNTYTTNMKRGEINDL